MVSFLVTFSGGQGGWGRNIVFARFQISFVFSSHSVREGPPAVCTGVSARSRSDAKRQGPGSPRTSLAAATALPRASPPGPGPRAPSALGGVEASPHQCPPPAPPTPPGSSFGRPPGLAVVGVCGVSPSEAFRGLGLSPEEGAPPCFMLTALVTAHKPSYWSARPLQRLRGGGAGAWRPTQRRLPWHTVGVQQQQA